MPALRYRLRALASVVRSAHREPGGGSWCRRSLPKLCADGCARRKKKRKRWTTWRHSFLSVGLRDAALCWAATGLRPGWSRSRLAFRGHVVPLAAPGPDQLSRRRIVQLAAEVVHVDVDDVGGLCRLHLPHRVEQLHARHAVAAMQHEVLEQSELLVGQFECMSGAARRMLQPADFEVAGVQGEARIALAAEQSAAAGAEFLKAERLQQKIVGAAVKTTDARLDF